MLFRIGKSNPIATVSIFISSTNFRRFLFIVCLYSFCHVCSVCFLGAAFVLILRGRGVAGVEGKDWCIFFFSEGFSGVHIRCGGAH